MSRPTNLCEGGITYINVSNMLVTLVNLRKTQMLLVEIESVTVTHLIGVKLCQHHLTFVNYQKKCTLTFRQLSKHKRSL